MPRNLHPNSLAAYAEDWPRLDTNAGKLWLHLCHHGPQAIWQLMDWLGTTDRNKVAPRVADLKRDGWVIEDGNTRCPVTGKTVALWRAVSPAARKAKMETLQLELYNV